LPEQLFLINPGLQYPKAVEYMAKSVYPEFFLMQNNENDVTHTIEKNWYFKDCLAFFLF
jgi:hypothetical protein